MAKRNVIASSGSLATDLGLPDPEETDIKAKLAARLSIIIQERGLSQTEAARIIGTDQAKVSAVLNGQFRGFSVYRLMTFLKSLDQDVEILVRPKVAGEAHLFVVGDQAYSKSCIFGALPSITRGS